MKIEGYFSSMKAANETVNKLKSQGLNGAFVDINEHRTEAYSKDNQVASADIPTLSQAVLGTNNGAGDGSSSPLAAASPMASGMGGFEEIADINCKVVVEAADGNEENVKNTIRSMGGSTDDPNNKIPKGIENISEDELILKNLRD